LLTVPLICYVLLYSLFNILLSFFYVDEKCDYTKRQYKSQKKMSDNLLKKVVKEVMKTTITHFKRKNDFWKEHRLLDNYNKKYWLKNILEAWKINLPTAKYPVGSSFRQQFNQFLHISTRSAQVVHVLTILY